MRRYTLQRHLHFTIMTDAPYRLLTKERVAEIFDISVRTLENWVNQGLLPPPSVIENRRYWHSSQFYAFIEQRYFSLAGQETASSLVASESAVAKYSAPAEPPVNSGRGFNQDKRPPLRGGSVPKQVAVRKMGSRSAADLASLNGT